ncbi:MAG TPA: sigma-70 family RNA polymerase sigma factor [Candidatus Saccharimonadales bacterium]|nr:sigma-70 family RNA polymerase sigma factor [Candidatus Saccharimonadales bacterium]
MEETLTVSAMSEAGWTATEFDDIVREHQARIYRLLWCELRDDEAAATLTQDCFLKAYRARAEFRGDSSVSTWLIRIAVNLARDYQRNRRQNFWRRLLGNNPKEAELATEMAVDSTPRADRALLAREELQRTMAAVKTLSPQQRTVFHLRFLEEFSIEEIAQAMEIEIGTVKSHLSRAVKALRQQREKQ